MQKTHILRNRLLAAAVISVFLCMPSPARAASKEIVELQTQVQQLLDSVQRIQTTLDSRLGVIQHLAEQTADDANRMTAVVTALQQKMAAQSDTLNGKLDTASGHRLVYWQCDHNSLDSISNGNRSETSPSQKRVLLLKPRGFCAGVVRAIDIVKIALETFGAPIYVRREIVHNRYVVNELAEKGAIFVHEIDDVPDGQRVIYSAHGVSPAVREISKGRNLR
jgi:4-hydroxy-3-methylbut-2-enyl diphosphate reductase IspH